MSPYRDPSTAWNAVFSRTTPPEVLAVIAELHPEFRSTVARHPNSPARAAAGDDPVPARRAVSTAEGDGIGVALVPGDGGRAVRRDAVRRRASAPVLLAAAAAALLLGLAGVTTLALV